MSKTITAAAQAKLDQKLGTEPIIILAVSWDRVDPVYYADKDLVVGSINAEGRILGIGSINSVMKQFGAASVSTVGVTLDDSDGVVKTVLDSFIVDGVGITIYQHYEGGIEADLFKLFEGVVTAPIQWSEADRSLSFQCETRVADREYGYAVKSTNSRIHISSTESYLVNPEATGKAWPLVFGTPDRYVAPKITRSPQVTLSSEFILPANQVIIETVSESITARGFIQTTTEVFRHTLSFEHDRTFTVEEADGFIINRLYVLELKGVLFEVRYLGGLTFQWGVVNLETHTDLSVGSRVVGDLHEFSSNVFWLLDYTNNPVNLVGNYVHIRNAATAQIFLTFITAQDGPKVFINHPLSDKSGEWIILKEGAQIVGASRLPGAGWRMDDFDNVQKDFIGLTIIDNLTLGYHWNIPSGSVAQVWNTPEYVVASIGLCTVHSVYAQRDGTFQKVPEIYYDVNLRALQVSDTDTLIAETFVDGSLFLNCTVIQFNRPLEHFGWDSSEIQVHATGPVGGNTSDQIKYLVGNYSLLSADTASFASVAAAIPKYPSDFALLTQGSTLAIIEDIAFQARCAIVISEGVVKLKYLSADPSSDLTTLESNVEYKTLELSSTSAEDVVTRLRGVWRSKFEGPDFTYAKDTNIAIYGLREEVIDFFIYRHFSLVKKSVDFWATRKGNVWRIARFNNFLQALTLDVFDTLTLAFTDTTLLGIASIKSVLQAHEYNISDGTVGLEVWIPSVLANSGLHPDAWVDDSADAGITTTIVSTTTLPHFIGELNVVIPQKGPALITRVLDLDTDPAALLAAGKYTADIYGNGLEKPPTRTGVVVDAIDVDSTLTPGDLVTLERSQGSNQGAVITKSYASTPPGRPIIAVITGNGATAGDYTWDLHLGSGPAQGVATELNGSTGIGTGTIVLLIKIPEEVPESNPIAFINKYYFFFPIEECAS